VYLPNLAPSDFFLFPKMKIKFKGRRFDTVEETQAETQTVLNTLTKKHLQEAFQMWQKRWDLGVHSQGDYFKGDDAIYIYIYIWVCVLICNWPSARWQEDNKTTDT
jgi:hypothetical protein